MPTDSSEPTDAPVAPTKRARQRVFRWRAIVPLVLFFVAFGIVGYLFLDLAVERAVEAIGTNIVGAQVDVAEADVRLRDGFVTLRGLQVTNPDAPMTNLIEAGEFVADIRMLPLLEKKIFIDTVAVRAVRFNTPRETSGALAEPSETSKAVRRQVDSWANSVQVPAFSLSALGQALNVAAIRPESLATIRAAVQLTGRVDSASGAWVARLRQINPQTTLDSSRALLARLEGASLRSLGVSGVVASARQTRSSVQQITSVTDSVRRLEGDVRAGVETLRGQVDSLRLSRDRDIAYARGLLNIPSLNAPDLSPSVFGAFVLSRLKPIMYWLGVAETYLPPGLNPRRRLGPKRSRAAGETVAFPGPGSLPGFTLDFADVGFEIAGSGAGAGAYAAVVRGLTSAPSLLGRPLTIDATRASGGRGPESVVFGLLLDHVTPVLRDSIALSAGGVVLPTLNLPGLGATLNFGTGTSALTLRRVGDSLTGNWIWRSSNVGWLRNTAGQPTRVEDFLWGAVSAIPAAEVEVRFSGSVARPRLAIRSNIGSAIASGLRQQLQGEIEDAERRVRAEVDRLVARSREDAEGRFNTLRDDVGTRISDQRAALEQTKAGLETRLRELTRMLPPGIGIGN